MANDGIEALEKLDELEKVDINVNRYYDAQVRRL